MPGRMDRPAPAELLAVALGGMVGALGRLAVIELLPTEPGAWPWGTLLVNVCGAFLLGWAFARFAERPEPALLPLRFLGTGVCGALTTFSTLQLELLEMLDRDELGLAAAYLVVSVVVGLAAAVGARRLGLRGVTA